MKERISSAEAWIISLKIKFKYYSKAQREVLNRLKV